MCTISSRSPGSRVQVCVMNCVFVVDVTRVGVVKVVRGQGNVQVLVFGGGMRACGKVLGVLGKVTRRERLEVSVMTFVYKALVAVT